MKQLVICLTLVCMVATVQAQNAVGSPTKQCSLTVAQAPEIRGVRLGMTVDKLLAEFPEEPNQTAINNAVKAGKAPDNYGVGRISLDRNLNLSNPKFQNVSYISVDLLDGRVSSLYVSYFGPEWKNTDQFITKLAQAFHLPASENWDGGSDPNRNLSCDGFVVNAFAAGSNASVTVRTNSASKTVNDRREAAKEKVRDAFKP